MIREALCCGPGPRSAAITSKQPVEINFLAGRRLKPTTHCWIPKCMTKVLTLSLIHETLSRQNWIDGSVAAPHRCLWTGPAGDLTNGKDGSRPAPHGFRLPLPSPPLTKGQRLPLRPNQDKRAMKACAEMAFPKVLLATLVHR